MAILKVGFAEATKERVEKAGFIYCPPKKCNCDCASYQHTHDSYYFDWKFEIENEYDTFDEV